MTTFTGYKSVGPEGSGDVPSPRRSDSFDVTHPLPYGTLRGAEPENLADYGSLTNNLPISEIELSFSGSQAASFSDIFYHRFHVNPSSISAGNIVTTQTYELEVWNAHLVPQTLDSIVGAGAEGLTLTPGEAIPSTWAPLESQTFVLELSNEGPTLVDAVFTLTTGDGEERTLVVTGQRVIAWTFRPNWSRPIIERLQWMTNTISSYNGTEQRVSLRPKPRRVFEFDFVLDNLDDRRRFEALLWSWGGRSWMVPIWIEEQRLASTLASGAMSVTLPRVCSDYDEGGNLILMTGPFDFEVMQIDTVSVDTVYFTRGTTQDWPANLTSVMPCKSGRLDNKQPMARFTGEVSYGSARFQLVAESNHTAATETTYRDLPVLTTLPVWASDITQDYERKLELVDFAVGSVAYEDEAEMPFVIQSHHWTIDGKDALDDFRAFLYARKGKAKAMWVPTFTPDLVLVTTVGSGDLAIDVKHGYLVQHLDGYMNRRDIRVELHDGTIFYRRITDFNEVDDTTERLSIDTSFARIVTPAQVARISWMVVARLDTDVIELAHRHHDWAEASANWRSVRYDI